MDQVVETESDRVQRIREEAGVIAKAHADIDAGLGIKNDDLEAWLDELDRNPDAPIPTPRISSSQR